MQRSCLAKKGVSLVTVLIFMMIATIAATATYKWLSSEGFTSADRMAMSEAKEASHAGLESVRSWMTYHANDVGAILRQYYDGGKKPVALTNVVRSMNTNKQVFNVWLTGVETSGSAYKFTIVSNGIARGNAKYSETSILSVRGLYKVKEPSVVVANPLDYHQSYFGGTLKGAGKHTNSSMIINGSWEGNPTGVTGDFVVTGKVALDGKDVNLGEHACIGGDFNSKNEGAQGKDLYVKGNTTDISIRHLRGNAVFDGSVTSTTAGTGLNVDGDVTFKGRYTTERTKPTKIEGNLCFEQGGSIKMEYGELQTEFTVNKNVTAKSSDLFENTFVESTTNNITLGKSGYSIYMPGLNTCTGDGSPASGCKSGWKYQNHSKFFKSSANVVTSTTTSMHCDTSIVTYCKEILGPPRTGCKDKDGHNTGYKIDDMITTAYDSFSQMADKVSCAKIQGSDQDNFDMGNLTTCYNTAPASALYHGYLVVKLYGDQNHSIFKSPSGTLDGNFIFIANNKLDEVKVPPTTATSNVFFYMKKGAKMINTIKDQDNDYIYNYFFYSEADIDEVQHNTRDKTYLGSFYLTASNCSRIKLLNTPDIKMVFNQTLAQNLIDSAVICGFDEAGHCGSLGNDGEDDVDHGGEEMNTEAGYDRYYVATAPQLSITLESQRRNKEILYDNLTSQQYTTVKPSIIMLPRIAYLSNTPAGRLKDYFKVINLNGANETYVAGNTSCTPNLNTNENDKLYTGTPLSASVYKCEYTASNKNYGKIPFWLVVDAEAAKKSAVSFESNESRIFGGGSVTVRMSVDGNQREPVTAVVRVSEVPTGWAIHPSGDYVVLGASEADGASFYSVTLPAGMETPVFQVEAEAGAVDDQVNFTITSISENARLGDHPSHSVWLNGAATIKREDIPRTGYCDNNKHKTINGVECTDIVNRPNCEGNLVIASLGEWVRPNCPEITTQETNNQWGCGLSTTEPVRLAAKASAISLYCNAFIPDSSISSLHDGNTYTFYASYKAKLFNLKVFLNGAEKATVDVRYSQDVIKDAPADKITTKHCTAGDTCVVPIYAGYNVDVTAHDATGESFKFWKFLHSQNSDSISSVNPKAISLQHDTTVIAQYDQLENHCFYTDFKDVKIWCDGSTDECIDKCKDPNKHSSCSVNGDGSYPKSSWLIPRTNNGNKSYARPQKEDSDKFIYHSAGNGNNNSSKVTYLLNRTQAGGHGTLTSRFKTCYFNSAPGNSFLNSGFMLRSSENAGSYNIVQIYARKSMHNSGNYSIDARICKGDGSGINNANSGSCQTKTFPNIAVNHDIENVVFNTDIEIAGDNATVKLSYKKDGSWNRSSVVLPLSVSANIDEYVGISMADGCFKVMNLGWESDEWDPEHCFDVPQVTCSFAANYLGGILPLNENVKPWVGTSNYFNDPTDPDKLRAGCTIKYHYNGCDLPSDYTTNTCERWEDGTTHCSSCSADSDGPYYVSGIYANTLKNAKKDNYKFTYAGLHGTSKTYDYNGSTIYGAVRDASIVVDCSGDDGNGRTYEATCGRFVVGSINECSQGNTFSLDNCSNDASCVANVSGGIANLRSSTILGEITGLPEDGSASVTMVLNDANGLQSQEYHINANGSFSRDVNLLSDMQDFDPEKVVSIEFTGTSNFTVNSLSSDCPNSVSVGNCTAEFQGDRFVVTSNIMNSDEATCKVDGADNTYKTEEKDCPGDGKFHVPAVDLQKNLNLSGSARSFAFTVTVQPKDGSEAQTCTTPSIEVLPNELTCSLSSTVPVNPGESLPSLNYQVTNCPASGCAIEARIGSEAPVRLVYKGNGQVNSWSPNINTTPGNYRYTLTYAGLSCTADITVVTGANGSTAKNCAIDEANKRFTADLDLTVGSTNNIKLWYLDKLGNTVGSSKSVSPSTTRFSEALPAIAEAGDYVIVLSINGEEACSVQYTYTEEEPAEEAQCYIEGGRFKTRNKNTTGSTMYGVALNRNTDGATYGDGVGSTSWPDGGYIDMDAYVPTTPGTYTYNLWYSGNVLCSVTYEVKDETEENP